MSHTPAYTREQAPVGVRVGEPVPEAKSPLVALWWPLVGLKGCYWVAHWVATGAYQTDVVYVALICAIDTISCGAPLVSTLHIEVLLTC